SRSPSRHTQPSHPSQPAICSSPLSSTPTPPTEIYPLSLHDALPIFQQHLARTRLGSRPRLDAHLVGVVKDHGFHGGRRGHKLPRSEEHTSELQSRFDLVCRLLLEKKKKNTETELSTD